MPDNIALVSKSKRLLISLHNEDCNFSITKDRSTLLFETADNGDISSLDLQLYNADKRKVIQSYNVPFNGSRKCSLRVDAVFPIVFEEKEHIESVLDGYPSLLANVECMTYELRIRLNFDENVPFPSLTRINSVALNIDSATVLVSRELLGIYSDFFTHFFYGDFLEKNTGSYCIREVDSKQFIWLIEAIINRKWNTKSVDKILSILTLADRFCMPNIMRHALVYIMQAGFDPISKNRFAILKSYIEFATRFSETEEFVHWIFERCQSSEELRKVAQSCWKSLTPYLDKFFQCMSLKQSEEKREKEAIIKRNGELINENMELAKRIPFQLFVKTLTGKTMTFEFSSTNLILDVKKAIEKREGIPFGVQRLILQCKEMRDGKSLGDYNVTNSSTIHMVHRLRFD